jgi:hypothetical protein
MHVLLEEVLCSFPFILREMPREKTMCKPFRNGEFPKMPFSREEICMREGFLCEAAKKLPALSAMTNHRTIPWISESIVLTDAWRRGAFHRETERK